MFTWNITTGLCVPTSCQNSAKEFAPGQEQEFPGEAEDFAPGQEAENPADAEDLAPEQLMKKSIPQLYDV